MNPRRVRKLNNANLGSGPVVYWMSRDQRVRDNWALLFAQELALDRGAPLGVVFCMVPEFLGATIRQYGFMLKGLEEVDKSLGDLGVPFFVVTGSPAEIIPKFVQDHGIGALITDFDPLTIKKEWRNTVAERVGVAVYEVDAHNIVPCWEASPKNEYGAYTLRPKLERAMPEFMDEFPAMERHRVAWPGAQQEPDWAGLVRGLQVDPSVPEVTWLKPGETAGRSVLEEFVERKLANYPEARNDPNKDGQSNISPYLHFGQISPHRVALEARKGSAGVREFLDELITWRELSDNFCYYVDDYTSFDAFPDWARKSLYEHRADTREFVYTREEFELAQTHDPLWNASQMEMVKRGKMHGYMRMYWAKKILEWTQSPEDALAITIYLNDRYELDGRDPNGYAGIAWAIGGVHDRPWGTKPVIGAIRYMSYNGCKSKFDVDKYIDEIGRLETP